MILGVSNLHVNRQEQAKDLSLSANPRSIWTLVTFAAQSTFLLPIVCIKVPISLLPYLMNVIIIASGGMEKTISLLSGI